MAECSVCGAPEALFRVKNPDGSYSDSRLCRACRERAIKIVANPPSKAKKTGVNKKDLGIKGKVTKKHLAVRRANDLFNLTLIQKDNDVADSLLLGTAYFLGAEVCDGT